MTIFYHDNLKTLYRQLYFQNFDNIINCIKDHFNQTGYQIYVHLQEILLKVFKEQNLEDDLQIVIQKDGVNTFGVPSLKPQLLFLQETAKFCGLDSRMQLPEMIALFKKLDTIKTKLVAEVIKLVKLILIRPATNAVVRDRFRSLKELNLFSLNND